MASLARFHLRLLQSWLPVQSSVWAFTVSLLHTGVVKGCLNVNISLPSNLWSEHMPQHKQTGGIWILSHPLLLKMFQNSDNPEKWHFASWQMLYWPYPPGKGELFSLKGSAWNSLQSTAVTRCSSPPPDCFKQSIIPRLPGRVKDQSFQYKKENK